MWLGSQPDPKHLADSAVPLVRIHILHTADRTLVVSHGSCMFKRTIVMFWQEKKRSQGKKEEREGEEGRKARRKSEQIKDDSR